MTVFRRGAALLTLALSLETTLLGSAAACSMPGGDAAAAMAHTDMAGMDMAGMDMAGMDMTPKQPQPGEDASRTRSEHSCSFPWSPPGDCHDMEACAPVAIAPPSVTLVLATPLDGTAVPHRLAGPRSLAHTPDPPPPRA